MGAQDNELVDKLSQAKSDDQDLLSLIEIAKARSWEFRNTEEYEKCLLKSIELCKTHVTNYVMLGRFYIKQGRHSEGVSLIKQALLNRNREDVEEGPASMSGLLEYFFADAEGIDNQLKNLVNEYENSDS